MEVPQNQWLKMELKYIKISINEYYIDKISVGCPATVTYEMAKETLMYRTVFWILWERERVG